QALWPVRYDEMELARIRGTLRSSFESLYQPRPSALEGAKFKREWWRYFREQPKFRRIVQSWDTAYKTAEANDYSVCTTWGEAESGYYLLDRWKRRVEFPALKEQVRTLYEQFGPREGGSTVPSCSSRTRRAGRCLIPELTRDTNVPMLPGQ